MHFAGRRWAAGAMTLAAIVVILILASCTKKRVAPGIPAAVSPAVAGRPVPPHGAPARLALPESDGKGGYRTINSGLSDAEAVWHLRSALNVAALSCDRSGKAGLATGYNRLLARQKAGFATAYRAESSRFGQAKQLDAHVTQIYNFFAQPPAQAGLCAAATGVMAEAQEVPPDRFADFAVKALDRLDRPFDAFYHAYARYQADLAAWEASGGSAKEPVVRMAAATPAPGQPWRIQLGAYSGREAAHSAWSRISGRMRDAAGFEPRYEPVPSSSLVRVRIGPISDRSQAITLCAAAAAAGLDCQPVPPRA